MYLLIKYIKSVIWRVAKCLSYIEEARCLKVNPGGKESHVLVRYEAEWSPEAVRTLSLVLDMLNA